MFYAVFLYKMLASSIFMFTFATATKGKALPHHRLTI